MNPISYFWDYGISSNALFACGSGSIATTARSGIPLIIILHLADQFSTVMNFTSRVQDLNRSGVPAILTAIYLYFE